MTFATLETSVQDGRPIELMRVCFLTNVWCYTTSETPIVFDGDTFLPLPIKHGEIDLSSDTAKSQVTISVPEDCLIGELFRVQAPPGVVTVTLFSKHVDEDVDVKVLWKGRIVNSDWVQPWLNLTSESIISSLQRVGLRRKYCIPCPHVLYQIGSGMCNVDRAAFKVDGVVGTISGTTISSAGFVVADDDLFAGGYAEWINADTGYAEKMMIKTSDHSGTIVVTSQPRGLVAGMTMSVYPGCDHTQAACARFNNSLNYGGMPFIPLKNPFDGATLY
jgi:uncharacterized phage protein (TIGR02218 family)